MYTETWIFYYLFGISSGVLTVKRLFETFHSHSGLNQGDALSSVLFNLVLEWAIRIFKDYQEYWDLMTIVTH